MLHNPIGAFFRKVDYTYEKKNIRKSHKDIQKRKKIHND